MRLRSLWLFLLFSFPLAAADDVAELIKLAKEQNPQAQYQLALAYQAGTSIPQNLNEAFYWFLQAAEQDYPAAMAQVASAFMTGQGIEKDPLQTQYWLTKLALTGNTQASTTLAKWYEQHPTPIASLDLAELWYRVNANHDSDSEQGYARLLEQKFNQLREKQLNSIDQLDKVIDQDLSVPSTLPISNENQAISTDWLLPSLAALLLLLTMIMVRILWRKYHHAAVPSASVDHEGKIKEQQFIIKRQKQQLDHLFQECKRLQQNQTNDLSGHKIAMAFAMMGFHQNQQPDVKTIKLRYKQLSKIYHPDMHGSDEEMKRLNSAVKIVIESVNKSLQKQA
ncbi:tetratricopeptide repeat protein [Vibrio mimicus]|uniref:tetratricopeptide repeat protein n=1 Tax=Vibrio mimicus TaxID=674 RepID=UPI0011D849EB|nr:tetratricopeptide repeat protein [Vibrio mimicus]TXY47172.1 J domain-containing protein [Vibrio mimicus]